MHKPEHEQSAVPNQGPEAAIQNGSGQRVQDAARVAADQAGQRLDQVAAGLFPAYSRARLQAWIREGKVLVDGVARRQRDRVPVGSLVTIDAVLEPEVSWSAETLPLNIVYEDDNLLVIDKPPGVVVHPGAGNSSGTLVNALLNHRPDLEQIPRAGIVHRIDKETSGLLVVAATLPAHASLVEQLQVKSVHREYLAVVRGCLTGGGTIDAPIGRHPRQRTRMAVVERGGKAAVTHYFLEQRFAHYTAVEVRLETGRTHQIRVHMAHRGYPLIGDPVYGGRLQLPRGSSPALAEVIRGFRRQALHARRLSFSDPVSGELREFDAPIPDDMRTLLDVLAREDSAATAGPR